MLKEKIRKNIIEEEKQEKVLERNEVLDTEITLEKRYERKNNIFDYIRIILAIAVIVTHCYPLFFGPQSKDPISQNILITSSIAGIAVFGFFIISGFMITQSMVNSKNNRQFILKRLIRIFPALIIMLLLTIFVLGPIVYDGNIVDYFKSDTVWKYFIGNINLFGNTEYNIDGVFENNIYPSAINGSLWTLKHEFIAYLFLMILSSCKILKNRKAMLVITIISIFTYILKMNISPIFDWMNYIGFVAEIGHFLRLFMYFLIGTTMYLYKDKIKMNFKYFIFACFVLFLGICLNVTDYALILSLPYILMYIGTFKFKKNFLGKIGDFSYALYIYAFPIQQLIVFYLKDKINIWLYMFLSVILTSIIAISTTYLIDNNIKKIKNKIS